MTYLFPGHGLGAGRLHFLRLLHQGAQRAAADHQQIVERGARDASLLPDLPSDLQRSHDVGNGQDVQEAAREAGLADGLSVLSELVAGHEEGDDAQPDVVEAAEGSVLPFCRHDGDVDVVVGGLLVVVRRGRVTWSQRLELVDLKSGCNHRSV